MPGALMLAAAAVLPRLPAGVGVPCPLRALTGVPCPLCGMTTSVVSAVQLRLEEAVAANPAGLLAVAVALVALALGDTAKVHVPAWMVPAGLALMWVFQLVRFALL